ncbi:MAG: EAL domain-containing protein [Pseudomonadota bacterium]|nr:EAL domain-containing protein [Pseudomonadota bacterium]
MFTRAAKGAPTAPSRARKTIRYKLILLVMTPLSLAVALITGVSTWSSGQAATFFGAALSALVGLAVVLRMQKSISGPIVALTKAMADVRHSRDYSLDSTLEYDDEIGDLVDGFNQMLGEIRERDMRLAGHVANLEREVHERTIDLLAAKETAEAAAAAKSDFLATMSHEIRTPMNGIMVMAEMLASAEMPQRQRRYAEVIAKSGRSLLSIINDILDFSKIEAGKMELEQVPLDLSELVDDVTSLFWERARHKQIDLAAYVDPATPRRILGDPVRLRQVIGNLVNNAIKFTPQGGVLVRVEPGPDDAIRVSVQDTGIGIPEDKLEGLFAAFSQVDQSTTRRFGGTGLGLAICKRLVEAMGGEVKVASVEGRGSTFSFGFRAPVVEPALPWPVLRAAVRLEASGVGTRFALGAYLSRARADEPQGKADIYLADAAAFKRAGSWPRPAICVADYNDAVPTELLRNKSIDAVLIQPVRRADLEAVLVRLAAGRPLDDLQQEDGPKPEAVLPRFEGRRVLVADDSPVNREVAVEALIRLGAEASTVNNGVEAVRAVTAPDADYDLVLMDGSMPEMDGFEATRAIRFEEKRSGRPRLPVVALTAHVVGAASEAWRSADMDAVLHKPFRLADLAEALAGFLEPSGYGMGVLPGDPEPAVAAPADLAPADDELLDPAVARDLASLAAAGQTDFVAKIHRLYRANAPLTLESMLEAAGALDAEGVARAAHALKSMSFSVGARRVALLCGELETAAREGVPTTALTLHELARALELTLRKLSGRDAPLESQSDDAKLLADLRAAIAAGELTMVYQAQMDRAGETLVGCEALVRWNHPERGAVSPAEFVPVAERAGVISELTDFVVRRVCQDMAPYGLPVSFNASALEFSKPGFAERMSRLIKACGYDPSRLEVEITETAVVDDAEAAKTNIVRLRAMGIKVALDDFGAGYTSLRFLRMFPFDKLKIDREFIQGCEQDPEAATIVHAVVSIGRALGMKVVAEGVETEAERSFLKVAGVHALQGWLFGKAVPAPEFAAKFGLDKKAARRSAA